MFFNDVSCVAQKSGSIPKVVSVALQKRSAELVLTNGTVSKLIRSCAEPDVALGILMGAVEVETTVVVDPETEQPVVRAQLCADPVVVVLPPALTPILRKSVHMEAVAVEQDGGDVGCVVLTKCEVVVVVNTVVVKSTAAHPVYVEHKTVAAVVIVLPLVSTKKVTPSVQNAAVALVH